MLLKERKKRVLFAADVLTYRAAAILLVSFWFAHLLLPAVASDVYPMPLSDIAVALDVDFPARIPFLSHVLLLFGFFLA